MRQTCLLLICLIAAIQTFAQAPDSAALARRDSLRMAKMLESAVYPLIKGAKWGGVIPVTDAEEIPDPNMPYNLLMDVSSAPSKPEKQKEINGSLAEVARIMNIHIAAGIPQKNLHIVVIAHGQGLFPFLTDEEYQKKFHCPNPNFALIRELKDAGVQFTACGQAMKFLNIEKAALVPVVKVAYSAKTVTSYYNMKGYLTMYTDD